MAIKPNKSVEWTLKSGPYGYKSLTNLVFTRIVRERQRPSRILLTTALSTMPVRVLAFSENQLNKSHREPIIQITKRGHRTFLSSMKRVQKSVVLSVSQY